MAGKRSIRPALVVLLVLFSVVPALGTVLLTVSARTQQAQLDLDSRVAETSRTIDYELKSDLERFRQVLLTSAQNPAYTQILLDPERKDSWKRDLNQSLLNLTTVFPGMIDEACRIDTAGAELGRVVQGDISPDDDLSPDESANPFFKPTVELAKGEVHFQTPYVSPDTKRWVISESTPLYVNGKSYGILHFEVPLVYYYHSLKSLLPHDGFMALVNPKGQIYLTSGEAQPTDQPFPDIRTLSQDPGLQAAAPDMVAGKTGFAGWSIGGTAYRMRYQRVELAPGIDVTLLIGLPAVPGFLEQLSPFLLPLLLGILAITLLAAIVATLFVQQVGQPLEMGVAPSERGQATTGKRHAPVWFVLGVGFAIALAAAYVIGKLHESVNQSHQAEVVLVRVEGLAQALRAVQGRESVGAVREPPVQSQAGSDPGFPTLGSAVPQGDEIRGEMALALEALARADGQGFTWQRVSTAAQQYQADIDQQDRLYKAGRGAEARTWSAEHTARTYDMLMDATGDGIAVYGEASRRANDASNAGSAIALIIAAAMMSFLFWRFEQARRTADLAAERALRRSEQRFRSLVQNSSDVITVIGPDATIHNQSASVQRVFGYEPASLVGTALTDIVHPEDTPRLMAALEDIAAQPGTGATPVACRIRHSDGAWRHAEIMMNNLLQDPNVLGIALNTRDVSERKALEEELIYRAFHDSLTNLANRALFMDRLEHAMAHTARRTAPPGTPYSVAVLFLDLDGFKRVNDTLGHRMGDQLLVQVSRRLQICLRPVDTVARLGGDEFTILLEDVVDASDATAVAQRITEQFKNPFHIEGHDVYISSSIGIAVGTALDGPRWPDGSLMPDALLVNADAAMYEAKNSGKARYSIFDPEKNTYALERYKLEGDMRGAIERREFQIHYQPVLNLDTGKVTEVEALLRWQHPERGIIAPDDFIPLAEETGLIVPIGRWVLEEACRQAEVWQQQYRTDPPLQVSVNLSAKQVQRPEIVEEVARALEQSGLDPRRLELEITETIALDRANSTLVTLQALRALGVRLAVDDFGTGYSTLTYLKDYPFDTLKLDRSFIEGLGGDTGNTAIVHTALAFAKALTLKVIAEGIETAEQLAHLRALGCEQGQGFYFARPVPAEAVGALLARGPDRESAVSHRGVEIVGGHPQTPGREAPASPLLGSK